MYSLLFFMLLKLLSIMIYSFSWGTECCDRCSAPCRGRQDVVHELLGDQLADVVFTEKPCSSDAHDTEVACPDPSPDRASRASEQRLNVGGRKQVEQGRLGWIRSDFVAAVPLWLDWGSVSRPIQRQIARRRSRVARGVGMAIGRFEPRHGHSPV